MTAPGVTTMSVIPACGSRYAIGLAAMLLSLHPLQAGASLPLLLASAYLFVSSATDTFLEEVPNPLNATMMLTAFVYHGATAGADGLVHAALGLLLGGVLLLIPFLLGGMGAGDVKALAALGALLGPGAVLQTFLYAGLIGGALALAYLAAVRSGKGLTELAEQFKVLLRTGDWRALTQGTEKSMHFPYAVTFCFGYYAYLAWGELL